MTDAAGEKYILQSVANALDILDLLTDAEELSVPEISEIMGLSRSSVFRLLSTLENRRFVRKTDQAKYRLGIKLTAMGNVVQNRMEIVQYAHSHMLELSRICGETCNLAIWDSDTKVRFVDRVLNSQSIRTDSWIGSTSYAHLLGSGKALLAFASPAQQEAYCAAADFTPQTERSILTPSQLRVELENIRARGYATDNCEAEDGLFCIGAPVFDGNGKAVAAISISGPESRMRKNEERCVALVCQTAKDISYSIRSGPPHNPLLH